MKIINEVCGLLIVAYLLIIIAFTPELACAEERSSAMEFQRSAYASELHFSPQWLSLLHYKENKNGWKSSISDPNFFLASDGRYNPEKELDVTIQMFFGVNEDDRKQIRCNFPARTEWLLEALKIPAEIKPPHCPINSSFLEKMIPQRAVLIFPAPSLRGAGAMFGHTLIRFDSEQRSPLLSYSINFAANTEYATFSKLIIDGVSGGFRGVHTLQPYYQKLRQYSRMEERDVWEYPLKLEPNEVRMMALHALELRRISTEYYFFDENCSLLMLALIDVGRPSLNLVRKFQSRIIPWVVPSDTIQYVWSKDIASLPKYEPSTATRLTFLSKQADQETVIAAIELLNDKNNISQSNIDPNESNVTDLASLALQYKFARLEMTQEQFIAKSAQFAERSHAAKREEIPIPQPPHDGHSSGRLSIATGFREHSPFLEIGFRPAYHSFNDFVEGYPKSAELTFIDLRGRYYSSESVFKLQKAELFNITSLMPESPFMPSFSWRLNVGAERRYLRDGRDHLLSGLVVGAGTSHEISCLGLTYVLLKGEVVIGSGLDNGFDVGPGIEMGVIKRFGSDWQAVVSYNAEYFSLSEKTISTKLLAEILRKLDSDNAIKVNFTLKGSNSSHLVSEGSLAWQKYF